eukprot:scaffold44113_cov60-Phaeocystis_antarctica.AAC.2
MAMRSPLTSAESVPPYAQLSYCVEDHPWPAMFRASTPLVSPRGSPLLLYEYVLQSFPDQSKAQRNEGLYCEPWKTNSWSWLSRLSGPPLKSACVSNVPGGSSSTANAWFPGVHPMSVAAMLCPLPSVESSTMLKASGELDSAATTMQSPGDIGGGESPEE